MAKLIDSGWLREAIAVQKSKDVKAIKRVKELAKEMAFKMKTPQLIPMQTVKPLPIMLMNRTTLRGSDLDAAYSFFQEIVANPEDRVPRMVFADWLDERGDPRGSAMRDLMPKPAEMTPEAFDGPHVTQHEVVRRTVGRPDEVAVPVWGDGSKGLFAAEMEVDLMILPPRTQLKLTVADVVRTSRTCDWWRGINRVRLHGHPAACIGVDGSRFSLSFKLRLFESAQEAVACLPLEGEDWPSRSMWIEDFRYDQNASPAIIDFGHQEYFCHGTLRDPVTALKLSLAELMPEHREHLEEL